MIVHPAVLAVLATDLLTILLVGAACWTAVQVVSGFRPTSSDGRQIALERRAEAASIFGRLSLLLFVFSSALTLLAVASILPDVVPGAMCGTGVLQAMGEHGERALAFRALALVALCAWYLVDGLDRRHPTAPLTEGASRAMLVALPLVALAGFETTRALLGLETGDAVDCCAVVYDAARSAITETASAHGESLDGVLYVSIGGTLLAVLGVILRANHRSRASRLHPALLAAATMAFGVTAVLALREQLAAYWYGVLDHDCLFCLFTGRHHWVGYPMLGAFVVAMLEGLAAGLASTLAARVPAVSELAIERIGKAGLRTAIAVIIFVVLAVGPAIAWRLRHGVWIEG